MIPPRYGDTRAAISSRLSEANCCQFDVMRGPTTGIFPNQSGGGGRVKLESCVAQLAISLKFSTRAAMPMEKGTRNTASKRSVMTVTASHRFPHIQRWSMSMMDQVETTI